MAETNINAYKRELAEAEKALDQAKARVNSLKAHIASVEGGDIDIAVEPVEVVAEDLTTEPETIEPVEEVTIVETPTPKPKFFKRKKGKK